MSQELDRSALVSGFVVKFKNERMDFDDEDFEAAEAGEWVKHGTGWINKVSYVSWFCGLYMPMPIRSMHFDMTDENKKQWEEYDERIAKVKAEMDALKPHRLITTYEHRLVRMAEREADRILNRKKFDV